MQREPRHLELDAADSAGRTLAVAKALASEPRLRILALLRDNLLNVSEIAKALGIPVSTTNLHLGVLERAGLVLTDRKPAARGSQKVSIGAFDTITVRLPRAAEEEADYLEVSMPVGAYVDCSVAPTCGLAGEHGVIGLFDDPASFFEPGRLDAQLLWFHHGYVEYRFPHRREPDREVRSLKLTVELCSEAPLHHHDWPSDITLWINGVEVGTWTSPADFGGQRGVLTPGWWEARNSQHGLLKAWQVDRDGSRIDGLPLSDVTVEDLRLADEPFIAVRVGVRPDARNVGGLNLFGRRFGNYPQDIVLRLQR